MLGILRVGLLVSVAGCSPRASRRLEAASGQTIFSLPSPRGSTGFEGRKRVLNGQSLAECVSLWHSVLVAKEGFLIRPQRWGSRQDVKILLLPQKSRSCVYVSAGGELQNRETPEKWIFREGSLICDHSSTGWFTSYLCPSLHVPNVHTYSGVHTHFSLQSCCLLLEAFYSKGSA